MNTIQLARQHEKLISQIRLQLLGPEGGTTKDRKEFAHELKAALRNAKMRTSDG